MSGFPRQHGHAGEEGSPKRRGEHLGPQGEVHWNGVVGDFGNADQGPDEDLIGENEDRIDHRGNGDPSAVAQQSARLAPVERSQRKRSFEPIDIDDEGYDAHRLCDCR